jgi:hypothetical protein
MIKIMCMNGPAVVSNDRAYKCPLFRIPSGRPARARTCTLCNRSVIFEPLSDGSPPEYVQDMIDEYFARETVRGVI